MARTAAVIDVGSNTVRLLVARRGACAPVPTHTERVQLALGREVEDHGRISDKSLATTADVVRRLCAHARAHRAETIDVLVTSPGRQAENGSDLVDAIERAVEARVRILSPDEEARLAFAGAVAMIGPKASVAAVVDLGGASTEIAVGPPETGTVWVRSVEIGTVSLTMRLFPGANPGRLEVETARAEVAHAFADVEPPRPELALVVGGSARALRRVLGPSLGPGELAGAASLLPMCSQQTVRRRFRVAKRRVPLLVATALVLAEVQNRLAVPLLVVDGGVREGALLELRLAAAA